MVLGGADETLALFGFGVDSFIEVISAVGIWHMIRRIRNNQGETLDSFEQRSLRITGGAFYTLTVGLILMALSTWCSNIDRRQPCGGLSFPWCPCRSCGC